MARVSSATVRGFGEAFLKPGDTEQEVAWRFAELAEKLVPGLDPVLIAAYRAHLREWVRIGALGPDEVAAGQLAGEMEMAVAFADLVGFTRLGGELEAGELDQVVSTFARVAVQAAGPRVRLVKTIGDAAMFASSEPDRLVASALELLEAAEVADLPSVRAGVAFGTTVLRAGDLYGQAVTLASRVTGVARPDSVLCTEQIRYAAPDQFEWRFARRHRLKGIGEAVPLYRARRLSEAGAAAA
jgi:adenylate cyclase